MRDSSLSKLPIFVFDFDGVVCDSTDECMVTSWNAWMRLQGSKEFRHSVSEFSDDLRRDFRELRPRVRGAGEYYILHRARMDNIAIENQGAYDRLEAEWHEYLGPYKKIFYEMRTLLRSEDLDSWLDLHPVFQAVVELMRRLQSENRLYIATLKDSESVRLIIERHGVSISEDRLLDQSKIASKLQALDVIRERVGCRKDEMIFIDDNVTHLLEPKKSGYPSYLTTWNKLTDEYRDIAIQNEIPLLDNCDALVERYLD